MRRTSMISMTAVYTLLVLALFQLSLACSADQRRSTIHTSVVAVNALREGFLEWDRQHQSELVGKATNRDEAEKLLTTYREQRQEIERGFEVAYRALALAATQTDDPSFQRAVAAAHDLETSVRALMEGK